MKKLINNIRRLSDIPQSTSENVPYFEMTYNKEIYISGIRGVLQYDSDLIVLNLGKKCIKICGIDLQIKNYIGRYATVAGEIVSLEFLS